MTQDVTAFVYFVALYDRLSTAVSPASPHEQAVTVSGISGVPSHTPATFPSVSESRATYGTI